MSKKTGAEPEISQVEQEQRAVAVSTGGAATQHNWRNIRLIIGREFKNRITQRSFMITSIILLVLVALGGFVPTVVQLITTRTSTQVHVVVVNNAGPVAGLDETMLASSIKTELNGTNTSSKAPYAITNQTTADLSHLQGQIKKGDLDLLLVLKRTAQGSLQFVYYSHADAANDSNISNFQTLAQQLNFLDIAHRLHLTPQQTSSLVAPPDLTVVNAQQSQTRSTGAIIAGFVLAFAGSFLIYIAVMLYGMSVAMGVAEEKSSRVMEILVNAATPLQLMVGKIIGIGAAGLTQMVSLVAVGIGTLLLQLPLQTALFGASTGGYIQYLTSISIPFYLLFLVYFLLDFFLYATLFAGLGALVKRQDEVQSSVQIPMLLLIGSYVAVNIGVYTPNAPWVKVLSYFPFSTSTLMLVRISLGNVAWWEIVLTIMIQLVTIAACTWFAARLYRMGVLMYGQRMKLGQLLKAIRVG